MNNSLFHKRIPTLLGLVLLGIGLVTVSILLRSNLLFLTNASPAYTPEQIRISNQTDTSFTISYVTDESVLGSLSYGEGVERGKVALDDRDQQSGTPKQYNVHHITLRNLKPETTYYYTILSSDKVFQDEGKKPFSIKTLSTLTQQPSRQAPIVGSTAYPDGLTDDSVMVFLVTDNAQVLSTLTKSNGSYVLPLNALRTSDFANYLTFKDTAIIKLLLQSPTLSSRASLLPTQINPVPKITLSNIYDFTVDSSNPNATPTSTGSAQIDDSAFPSFSAVEDLPAEPAIISPDNKEELTDQQPKFEGTSAPNEEVLIEIHSDPITASVKADKNGAWSYRPPANLSPGEHTITIKTKNSKGILTTITRNFTVFAEGSQFTEPSVSPVNPSSTPTVSQTPTPSPAKTTPTIVPSASPTAVVTVMPTLSPTAIASASPEATSVPQASLSPSPTMSSPGSSNVIFSGIITILVLGVGTMLFFMTRGSTL
ncbi:MAG: fibronectin type III domain-containing protein [Candidatus Levybacteria bacterium]|nr:fibronectin type III domain-containing protein [Candidatus Levybacteria bacterium]